MLRSLFQRLLSADLFVGVRLERIAMNILPHGDMIK
jgi:hypothetical protein